MGYEPENSIYDKKKDGAIVSLGHRRETSARRFSDELADFEKQQRPTQVTKFKNRTADHLTATQ